MTIDLNNLTKEQNILFDKIFNETKPEYIKLIDDIYSKSDKSIYFLLSSVTSRDLFLNSCLIKLTQLSFIKHYLINHNVKTIIVYDHNQKRIIQSFMRKHKLDARIDFINLNKYRFIHILKFLPRFLMNINTVIHYFRVKSKSRLNKIKGKKEIILINTYFIPSMFVGNEYQDRYYPKLIELANNKKDIFFSPTCFLGNKLSNTIKICEKSNINFIYNFDLLKMFDYLCALFASCLLIKYRFRNLYFLDFDVSPIINEEMRNNIISHSLFLPLLNYFYLKRLKEEHVDIKLFIDWFENQQLNRSFNISKSLHYPNVKSIGYQGWIVSNNLHYFHRPTKFEKDIGSIPDEIAVIGRGLVKKFPFGTNVKTIVSPAFRFNYIHHQTINILEHKMILISLPVNSDVANYILKFCSSSLHNDYHSCVVVNYHPVLKLSTIKNNSNFEFSDKSFRQLIVNTGIVISNTSSTCVESLALGVPVIILHGGSNIKQNPIPNTIDKSIWDECDNETDFKTAFTRLYIKKNIEDQSNTVKFIRKEFFEPVSKKSVNHFLGLNN